MISVFFTVKQGIIKMFIMFKRILNKTEQRFNCSEYLK